MSPPSGAEFRGRVNRPPALIRPRNCASDRTASPAWVRGTVKRKTWRRVRINSQAKPVPRKRGQVRGVFFLTRAPGRGVLAKKEKNARCYIDNRADLCMVAPAPARFARGWDCVAGAPDSALALCPCARRTGLFPRGGAPPGDRPLGPVVGSVRKGPLLPHGRSHPT